MPTRQIEVTDWHLEQLGPAELRPARVPDVPVAIARAEGSRFWDVDGGRGLISRHARRAHDLAPALRAQYPDYFVE